MAAALRKIPATRVRGLMKQFAQRTSRCDVHPLQQVGAPKLVQVAGGEVADSQHVLPGRGHEISRSGELANEHGCHLIPLLLHGGGALLAEHPQPSPRRHHLLCPLLRISLGARDCLPEVAGKVHAAASLQAAAPEHSTHGLRESHADIAHHKSLASQASLFEAGEKLPPEGLTLGVAHFEPQQHGGYRRLPP